MADQLFSFYDSSFPFGETKIRAESMNSKIIYKRML
jgi:hypothetical protein